MLKPILYYIKTKFRYLLPALLAVGFYSCLDSIIFNNEKGIALEITNNSGVTVTNISFTTTERIVAVQFDSLANTNKIVSFLPMTKNKTDGAYILIFTRKTGTSDTIVNGYYSNGAPQNSKLQFQIESDSTTVQSIK